MFISNLNYTNNNCFAIFLAWKWNELGWIKTWAWSDAMYMQEQIEIKSNKSQWHFANYAARDSIFNIGNESGINETEKLLQFQNIK